MIACQHEAAIRPDQPRQLVQHGGSKDPPRRMTSLRPGVGKQHIGTGKAGLRHAGHDQAHIVIPDTDVGQPLVLDMPEQAGNAVDKRFGTDETGIRTCRRESRQILAAAKAYLEEYVIGRMAELRRRRLCRIIAQ